ncbi:MAG TPA: PRC-barrel domain-containing protein [Steroidobacteraceae bacterium]|nr:PRC-barrel domain-containing protein [Steroidobacteraceae bacterium]
MADAKTTASSTGKQTPAIVGTKVEMSSGENLGEVKEVLLDKQGDASYAIIAHGGFMGVNTKRTAVPWKTVETKMHDGKLVMDRSQLEHAPVLAGSKTPDASSGTWSRDADSYWRGITGPAAKERS